MIIKTSDINSIKPFLKKLTLPKPNSHKGQNGKILIIGGSTLFHSASIWAAEIASHFADMVHYSSTEENNEVFLTLKKKFRNGIIVSNKNILDYVEEDDVILMGPGMVRGKIKNYELRIKNFSDILKIKDEAEYTYQLAKYLLTNYPNKKFVLDAGALQMMDPKWLTGLKTKAIITPHQGECAKLFGESVVKYSVKQKVEAVQRQAKKYNCVILLKAVDDFISDGEKTFVIKGGNAGLTKGGTGDVLAGLSASFYAKNKPVESCVFASLILKKTAERLFLQKGYWYNITNIIDTIPQVLKNLIFMK
ncbi:NAD(P)H-hydrate dehydratase [Candidatus Roizmanbacteria bacterium RIFCSPHIGHO2_01_FULL_35_10]|uniref:ADP-dependent (S)-NAD(P)H-hydrate dehydratase n=1 Tax=Candidatus Roizmanbacteria bacterium RIFCSPLOWO2_01_FULL_35_13 TaxID=1802055 RepID=A0A1F7I829_9BACT|nr:MAG: NAD(P)H-hydrate dehydratase [Candidatus Roizmanbacteria bacterium RIFCSPHIGHO2_01_FULL_35_10]OGK39526.1 MAG: NAD(P)H-hydrate dehydratase [Candidatus Roizmanbacteria bacterium RIFCSPLOWO2_01_FULL_35_13]